MTKGNKMRQVIYFVLIFIALFGSSCEKNPINNGNPKASNEERILFIKRIKRELRQICTMKPDGSDINIIYETEISYTNQGIIYTKLSPDKSKILFEGGPSQSLELTPIWILDAIEGEILYQLTWDGGNSLWSPDGKYIIFARLTNYGSLINALYRIKSDGSNEELFYQQDSLSVWPWDWSSDGEKLLVGTIRWYVNSDNKLSSGPVNTGIFDMKTKSIQFIFHNGMSISWANWTANQNEIIYVYGSKTQKYDIYLLNLGDSTVTNLTNPIDLGDFHNITLSPSNEKIAFSKKNSSLNSEFEYTMDIFVLDINSKLTTQLTNIALDSISCEVMDWK